VSRPRENDGAENTVSADEVPIDPLCMHE